MVIVSTMQLQVLWADFAGLPYLTRSAVVPPSTKLMRLGSPNRIDDDSDSKAIYIDRRIIINSDSNDLIESTITISI